MAHKWKLVVERVVSVDPSDNKLVDVSVWFEIETSLNCIRVRSLEV